MVCPSRWTWTRTAIRADSPSSYVSSTDPASMPSFASTRGPRLSLVGDLAQDPIDHAEVSSEEVRRQESVPDPRTSRMAHRLSEPEIRDER